MEAVGERSCGEWLFSGEFIELFGEEMKGQPQSIFKTTDPEKKILLEFQGFKTEISK
jgi:hypothetical protein